MLSVLDPFVLLLRAPLLPLTDLVGPVLAVVALTVLVRAVLHPLVRHAHLAARDGRPGCLSMLVQLPVLLAIYRLFTATSIGGHANALLDQSIAGVSLGAHLFGGSVGALPVFGVLVALVALVCWLSFRFARATAVAPTLPDTVTAEQAEAMARVTRVMPFLSFGSLLGAVVMPLAGGVYLLTSLAFGLAERVWLRRQHPPLVAA